ncbi:MAG: hypothetical protein LQ342_007681 [Letrouitia transgressa]|nr:MAG: hypothetical protein LQ342_007681 [Letrouitia transgressa]
MAAPSSSSMSPVAQPMLGRSKTTTKQSSQFSVSTNGKHQAKSNGSILNFFKKASSSPPKPEESIVDDDDLFLTMAAPFRGTQSIAQTSTPPREFDDLPQNQDTADDGSFKVSYHEAQRPFKRQRTEEKIEIPPSRKFTEEYSVAQGPFIDDSNSEKDIAEQEVQENSQHVASQVAQDARSEYGEANLKDWSRGAESSVPDIFDYPLSPVAPLNREQTSYTDTNGFDGIEDFSDEFPEEGEEYIERRWMEEQGQLEMGVEDDVEHEGDIADWRPSIKVERKAEVQLEVEGKVDVRPPDAAAASCPICGGSFDGLSEQDPSKHVNDCLDGKALPLPTSTVRIKSEPSSEIDPTKVEPLNPKRFQRAAIAKPGQENPFNLTSTGLGNSSAFSKLMSGHAEDAAWAAAAASESASRGKPAYQRTCPFYKILPGFYICVDAFRYGSVEGCKAYFLSHFHSDHYIGLTSSWCHGPIYCSHVTANLVRRQLRVDPKWVVDLEFDRKLEVPGTQGVEVTMIPANHCPGSSLFLYEKVIGRGKNPKVRRVLHCGDFRACPAHVQHSLLRPDVIDTVTKKNIGQQKLDVCYLDTTYLTPRYAFPSQEEVIKACADMCVSLSKIKADTNDSWERTKRERGGSGMVKFVRQASDLIKEELGDDEMDTSKKSTENQRGRLLVVVGTYSIGKERICLGVAKALDSKIYAPPNKQRVVAALEDADLSARMTDDPLEAQVHMQMLMEIRAETLADYLTGYKPHFSRIVGFRPSGWNYRPPNSRFVESPSVQTVLHSDNWKSRYSMAELVPQRGSTREASCFGVPYSEHSSFRELTMFCCALRIDKIIPTVNVGSAKSREKMKGWCEKWAMEKKRNGLFKVADDVRAW